MSYSSSYRSTALRASRFTSSRYLISLVTTANTSRASGIRSRSISAAKALRPSSRSVLISSSSRPPQPLEPRRVLLQFVHPLMSQRGQPPHVPARDVHQFLVPQRQQAPPHRPSPGAAQARQSVRGAGGGGGQ